jgi:hypothetical protein
LAAIDLGPESPRVLYHAAGFARLLSASLVIVHASADSERRARRRVVDYCTVNGPYEFDPSESEIVVAHGPAAKVINREAATRQPRLVVIGSRGHTSLTRLFVGSTGDAVLRGATTPVLMVPSSDRDIVNLSDRALLTCGPILVPIDMDEDSDAQLAVAHRLARISRQPSVFMTVAPRRWTDDEAKKRLTELIQGREPTASQSVVVRRGRVPNQIAACAELEGSGLVVMGLGSHSGGPPGRIASAVLRTRHAFVIAVPGHAAYDESDRRPDANAAARWSRDPLGRE